MRRLNETVSRQLRKFTSELTAVGNHNVVDLTDEDAVIEAFRTIQKYIFGILQEATDKNTAPDRRNVLMDIVSKGKQELRELKPYIKPETVYELEMSFRNLGVKPKKLSEHKECANMDKKLGDGFEDAIDELVGLSGAYEVSDEPMKNCCDIFADVAAELDCCDDDNDENEMSDAMGMELKDNDEELNEAIKDFLPRAGFIRNEEGGKMGGFVGTGSDDTIKKAKALARARFQYLGDRMGHVSKDDVKHFDERFYEITGRYPTEEDLYESVEVQPDMLDSDFDRADFDGKEAVDFNELNELVGKIAYDFDFIGENSDDKFTYLRYENRVGLPPEEFKEISAELKARLKERYGSDVFVKAMQADTWVAAFDIRVVNSDFLDETAKPKSYLKPLKEADDATEDEIAVSDFDGKEAVDFNELNELVGKIAYDFDFIGENSDDKFTYLRYENRVGLPPEEFKEISAELKARLKERYGSDVFVKAMQADTWVAAFDIRVVNSDFLDETAKPKSYLKPLKEADDATEDEIAVSDFDAEAGVDGNPIDEIRMDVPLFMRCLEFAREEAQDDMDLHHLVEKAVEMSKGGEALTMEAYADLVGEDAADEAPVAETPIEEAFKKPRKEGCAGKRKWKRIEKKSK